MNPEPDPNDPTPGAHIWGWMAPVELQWLHDTARGMRSAVEVGCNRGRSAYAIASGLKAGGSGGSLVAVDPWDDEGEHGYRAFVDNVCHLGNVQPIKGLSPGIIHGLDLDAPGSFVADMVFLDGDHEYEHLLGEIRAWLPRTERVLCGHDYYDGRAEDAGYPGVKQAVDEIFGGVTIVEGTSIWVVATEGSTSSQ